MRARSTCRCARSSPTPRGSAAPGILLAHNHPSGDPTPSAADCRATRTLARAAEAIDLAVVDHMIFAKRNQCQSMRRMGLL